MKIKDTEPQQKIVVDLKKLTLAERQAVYRTIMCVVRKIPSDHSIFVRKSSEHKLTTKIQQK